jgi:electron transfer flavoprotein alpha subunit
VRNPRAVIASASDRGAEIMAFVAALLDAPLAANCVEVAETESDDDWTVTRQRWGGSLLEEARVSAPVKLLTVAPHALLPERIETKSAMELSTFVPSLTESDVAVRITDRVEVGAGKVSLSEAKVVVGGGRGVGGAEGFGQLEELAGLLGGAVGCSRVVTSNGWRPHTDQIGQTGTRIAPDLYVACGISGATQHIVGCRAAKKILVINTDPEAPILSQADYAIIGDLRQIVPAISAEIRKASGG